MMQRRMDEVGFRPRCSSPAPSLPLLKPNRLDSEGASQVPVVSDFSTSWSAVLEVTLPRRLFRAGTPPHHGRYVAGKSLPDVRRLDAVDVGAWVLDFGAVACRQLMAGACVMPSGRCLLRHG